jgi:hypothetical protein
MALVSEDRQGGVLPGVMITTAEIPRNAANELSMMPNRADC